ncbi:MAG: small multi-drug export protein [Actinomycetota bacterium]|nr:small multi-drug export protein [Actinomycetota bacterium]
MSGQAVPYSSAMREEIVAWVAGLPPPLAVMVLATLPILELRGAIPLARQVWGMSAWEALGWSLLGNALPVPFILALLGPVSRWAAGHWGWLHRFLERIFDHSRRRHSERFERLRDLALITFVAVPLPITGAWSGALAAFVFGVPFWRALVLVLLGVVIAGVVVTVATAGGRALLG